jgi:uncharacterized protein (TIGR00369 family)
MSEPSPAPDPLPAPAPGPPPAAARTRTFSWEDPGALVALARGRPGLEFLRSLPPGASAPIARCLDFRLAEVDEGRVVFECTPGEYMCNPMGTVHGGVACTLCDSAAGAAVHSTLAPGEAYTTLEVKTNFVRPITARTGLLRCEGRVLHRGGTVATSSATLVDAAGKLHAHATATCMILKEGRG